MALRWGKGERGRKRRRVETNMGNMGVREWGDGVFCGIDMMEGEGAETGGWEVVGRQGLLRFVLERL